MNVEPRMRAERGGFGRDLRMHRALYQAMDHDGILLGVASDVGAWANFVGPHGPPWIENSLHEAVYSPVRAANIQLAPKAYSRPNDADPAGRRRSERGDVTCF